MRRLVAFNRVSTDGFFAAPADDLSWTAPDDEIDQNALKSMPGGRAAHATGLSRNVRLDLLEAKPYQSGNVLLRYVPHGV